MAGTTNRTGRICPREREHGMAEVIVNGALATFAGRLSWRRRRLRAAGVLTAVFVLAGCGSTAAPRRVHTSEPKAARELRELKSAPAVRKYQALHKRLRLHGATSYLPPSSIIAGTKTAAAAASPLWVRIATGQGSTRLQATVVQITVRSLRCMVKAYYEMLALHDNALGVAGIRFDRVPSRWGHFRRCGAWPPSAKVGCRCRSERRNPDGASSSKERHGTNGGWSGVACT
jgi:hypothetical protein